MIRKALLVVFAFVSLVVAQDSRPALTGSLDTVKGVRVLRLSGTPREMGLTHGWLMAEEILDGFDAYLLKNPLVGGAKGYTSRVLPMVEKSMTWSPEEVAELEGIIEGMTAKLGDAMMQKGLDRKFDLRDLKALNSYGDWYMFACAAVSVWGDLTPDGGTITARNFDFPPAPVLYRTQMLLAYAPKEAGRKRWVTVGFPGLIGVISGMNEDGVGIFVHDVNPKDRKMGATGVRSRLLALREALEISGAQGAPQRVNDVLKGLTSWMGNNIHVTSPFDGTHVPAAVIEYDGDETDGEGVTFRLPDPKDTWVVCTNHYRVRSTPRKCVRYGTAVQTLGTLAETKSKMDGKAARELMSKMTQRNPFSTTLHTVVFYPSQKAFDLALSTQKTHCTDVEAIRFGLDELLPPRAP